jgi:hypothetical protein
MLRVRKGSSGSNNETGHVSRLSKCKELLRMAVAAHDGTGQPLDGRNSHIYVLTFPASIPPAAYPEPEHRVSGHSTLALSRQSKTRTILTFHPESERTLNELVQQNLPKF